MTAGQIAVVEAALALWADAANVTFQRIQDSGSDYSDSAQFLLWNYTGATANSQAANASGFGGAFGTGVGETHYTYFNLQNAKVQTPTFDNDGVRLFIHEIGHALGLDHPGEYNIQSGGSQPTYDGNAEFHQDTFQYTVMSYFDETITHANFDELEPMTPMVVDIAAIQLLYGINTTTRTGNTTYGFNSNADRSVFHINSATDNVVFAVSDAGGVDTLDFSGYADRQMIDLRPGSFSHVGGLENNVSIALGTLIENAIGGSAQDGIYGNVLANVLDGGSGGDDFLIGEYKFSGHDTLIGGSGIDAAGYTGDASGVQFSVAANGSSGWTTTATYAFGPGTQTDTDTLSGIEMVLGPYGAQLLVGNGGFADLAAAQSWATANLAVGEAYGILDAADPNTAPTAITLPSPAQIFENSLYNGAVVGLLSTTDADAGDTHTYQLLDSAGGRFVLAGEQVILNNATFNFEAEPTVTIRVRVLDSALNAFEQDIVVAITNVNEAPTGAVLSAGTIAENAAPGTVVALISAVDPDAGGSHTFALLPGNDAGGRFTIVGDELRVGTTPLDYETAQAHVIQIVATDQNGLASPPQVLTIDVTDAPGVNQPPSVSLSVPNLVIPENAVVTPGIGIKVADVLLDDPDGGPVTLSLTGADAGAFEIRPNGPAADLFYIGPSPNYEVKNNYQVIVNADDTSLGGVGTDESSVGFTLFVDDVNEAPTAVTLTGQVDPAEDAGQGTVIGTLSALDPDIASSHTFSFSGVDGDAGGRFAILGNQLVLGATPLDFETATQHAITIVANDQGPGGLASPPQTFTINVTDVVEGNLAPTGLTLNDTTVDENSSVGTVVGTFSATDPNVGDTLTVTLLGGAAGGRFSVSGNQLLVASGGSLDHEINGTHTIDARVTDQGGLSYDTSFVITIDNVDPETVVGGAGNDSIHGGALADSFSGGNGDDTLVGGGGNDTLDGGLGFNVLRGGAGDDLLIQPNSAIITNGARAEYTDAMGPITVLLSGPATGTGSTVSGDASVGDDTLQGISWVRGTDYVDTFTAMADFVGSNGSNFTEFEGGLGDDSITGNANTRVSYRFAEAGVEVQLDPTGTGTGRSLDGLADSAHVGVDSFTGVNAVRGSQFDDWLKGSNGAAFENFRGQAGDDTIDGGGGTSDQADYQNSTSGIVVTSTGIGSATVQDGFGSTDTLTGIERIRGSEHADSITMDDGANRIEGRGGNDTINAGNGFDVAIYTGQTTDYSFALNAQGRIVLTDLRGGSPDGADTLIGVEQLAFANGNINISGFPYSALYEHLNVAGPAGPAWFDLEVGGDTGPSFFSPTLIVLDNLNADGSPNGTETRVYGSGFSVDGLGVPTGGTVTSVERTDTGGATV
jgi:hypothetical protein